MQSREASQKYGVIVSKAGAEVSCSLIRGVDTVEEQLDMPPERMIDPHGTYEISKFTVTRYK